MLQLAKDNLQIRIGALVVARTAANLDRSHGLCSWGGWYNMILDGRLYSFLATWSCTGVVNQGASSPGLRDNYGRVRSGLLI